jgi:hypothetical protein
MTTPERYHRNLAIMVMVREGKTVAEISAAHNIGEKGVRMLLWRMGMVATRNVKKRPADVVPAREVIHRTPNAPQPMKLPDTSTDWPVGTCLICKGGTIRHHHDWEDYCPSCGGTGKYPETIMGREKKCTI